MDLKKWNRIFSIGVAIAIVAALMTTTITFWAKSSNLARDLNSSQLRFAHQMTLLDQHVQIEKSLEKKVKELEATVKRVVSTSNKIEQARPQLVEWVYKHSRISRAMAEEIVDNVKESSCPLFLLALMRTESSFNPTAVSSKGAMGLGQIMPMHKKSLKGAGILKEMRDVFDIPTAVKATEFVWEAKMQAAAGDINRALALYLGAHNGSYVNRILKDYFHLNYLCRKPLMEQKAGLVPAANVDKNKEVKRTLKVLEMQKVLKKAPGRSAGSSISDEAIYTVEKGDYLSRIAYDAYGRSSFTILNAIKDRNPEIEDLDVIDIDQKIVLPVVKVGSTILTPDLSVKYLDAVR